MNRTTRRVDASSARTKKRLRPPGRNALYPVMVGALLTVLALFANHLVITNRTPTLFVGHETRNGTGRSLFQKWALSFSAAVRSADDSVFDLLGSLLPDRANNRPKTGEAEVVVVVVDGESLRRVGPWPWSRRKLGELLSRLRDAKVVGLDGLLHEPDDTSLKNYLSAFSALYGFDRDRPAVEVGREFMDNDLYFARRIAETKTVAGMYLTGAAQRGGAEKLPNDFTATARLPNGREVEPERALLRQARTLVANLPLFRAFDPGMSVEGFINLLPDESGAVKATPLMIRKTGGPDGFSGGNLVPALPLEMFRLGEGGSGYVFELTGNDTVVPEFVDGADDGKRYSVSGLTLVRGQDRPIATIPLNEFGEMTVPGPGSAPNYRIVPAWEALFGMHEELFRGKYVVCDLTATGSGGVGTSSPAGDPTPDAFIHASMLSTMIAGDFRLHNLRTDNLWQQALTLAAGALVSLSLAYGGPFAGGLTAVLALFGLTFGNYLLLFKSGVSVGATIPALAALAILSAQSSASHFAVGRERRFIRTAFSLNVSPSILNYLETHPDRLSALGGEQRDMTVLFSDIRGFTAISENMTAPDLARFLNEYLTPMSDIVMQNLGTVDKFMGDALMAFWNAPTNDPDHARNAARTALEMLDKLEELQKGWTERGLPRLAIGCGLNSGPMFAGYMGSEQRKNYTVMGDNVNIASRLEGLNKLYACNIIISEQTRGNLGSAFHSRVIDKVRVSGRREPVLIYELLGEGAPDEAGAEETATFERVFQLYQQRDFKPAEILLKELVFISPRSLYDMYLDRLAVYLALPPPPSWDGTFSVNNK